MSKIKNWFRNQDWTLGKAILLLLFILAIPAICIYAYAIIESRPNSTVVKADFSYMVEQIENEYGNGQKFIVVSEESEPMYENAGRRPCGYNDAGTCSDKEYVGQRYYITGYFEGQETGYFVGFVKYIKNSPYSGDYGEIVMVYMSNDVDISKYIK